MSTIVSVHAAPLRDHRLDDGRVPAFEEHVVELAPGERFRVRPVQPSDEEAVVRLLKRLSLEEVRLRFFSCMRTFTHSFVERLTNLDNIRDLGLVAIPMN